MHPIIQAEVDEFREQLKNGEFTHLDGEIIPEAFEHFLSAALHRAVEKSGKKIIGKELKVGEEVYAESDNRNMPFAERFGYNLLRSLALSKLDTIINFKE